jgi:ComF family protein
VKVPSVILELASGLVSLFYPPHCGACGCRLKEDREKDSLCESCQKLIFKPLMPCCPVCSDAMQGLLNCPNCEGRRWHLSTIVSGCRYQGLARELIQRFKYGRDQALMRTLGDLMLPALGDPRLAGKRFEGIVPVPLHFLRERDREFNQAALLSRYLAWHLGLPVLPLLKRRRATLPQAGFDRKQRLKNLEGAFELRMPIKSDMSILLVDDVTTTGTTLNACAELLMEAGAGEVCAVTVARG